MTKKITSVEPTLEWNTWGFTHVGSGLTRKQWKGLRDKHSSLLQTTIHYRCKKFYDIGPWCHQCPGDPETKDYKLFTKGKIGLTSLGLASLGLTSLGLTSLGLTSVGLTFLGLTSLRLTSLGLISLGLTSLGLTSLGLTSLG